MGTHKNPLRKKPDIDETPRRKTGKHKRHETACEDKRRSYLNCGICGSEDVAREVLCYCARCGNETLTITQKRWYSWEEIETSCSCKDLTPWHPYPSFKRIDREVCMACGSMKSPTCPSCGGERQRLHRDLPTCWTSPFGEKRCSCGFRHPGFKKS
jgi:hypothetical protein